MTRLKMYDIITEDDSRMTMEDLKKFNFKHYSLDELNDITDSGKLPVTGWDNMTIVLDDTKPNELRIGVDIGFNFKKTNINRDVLQRIIDSVRSKLIEVGLTPDKLPKEITEINFAYLTLTLLGENNFRMDVSYSKQMEDFRRRVSWRNNTPEEFFTRDFLNGVIVPTIDPEFKDWYNIDLKTLNRAFNYVSGLVYNDVNLSDVLKLSKQMVVWDKESKEETSIFEPHFKKQVIIKLLDIEINNPPWKSKFTDDLVDFMKKKFNHFGVEFKYDNPLQGWKNQQ